MMYEGAIQDLIDELGRLPGIGPKSAQRIAFHIIQSERVDVSRLIDVLRTVKERVKFCTECGNISEEELWACTSCRACEIACPVFIEQVDKIYDLRRNLVMMESRFPAEAQAVFKNMETNGTTPSIPR